MSAMPIRIGANHGVFVESLLLWNFVDTPNAQKHILVMLDRWKLTFLMTLSIEMLRDLAP